MLVLEGLEVAVEAQVQCEPPPDTWCHIRCQQHQFSYEASKPELQVGLFLRWAGGLRVDSADGLHVVLYDCSVGHGDCSRCQTAMPQYDCVWCEGEHPRCVAREACNEAETVATQCPAPLIHSVRPLSITATLTGRMSVPWVHRTQDGRPGCLRPQRLTGR